MAYSLGHDRALWRHLGAPTALRLLALVASAPLALAAQGATASGSGWVSTTLATIAALVGAGLAIWLVLAARDLALIARGYASWRVWLALAFVPGLYISLLLAGLLAIGGAGAAIWLIWTIFSFIGRIPIGIVLMLAFGAVAGVAAVVHAGWSTIRRVQLSALAVPLSPETAPTLFARLRDLAERMGCRMPDNVLLEMGTGFYVTEGDVRTLDGERRHRTLCLSAPLLRLLTPEQAEAIIAHEFAHFTGADTVVSRRFYPVYRGTSTAIATMESVGDSGSDSAGTAALALILPMLFLGGYLRLFMRLERAISRERELRADALAARATSPEALAGALAVVSAYAPQWGGIHEPVARALVDGQAFRNLSAFFAASCADHPDLVEGAVAAAADAIPHPTDTHPPMAVRLAALGFGTPESPSLPLGTAPARADASGASLVDDLDAIEARLSEVFTAIVARDIGPLMRSAPRGRGGPMGRVRIPPPGASGVPGAEPRSAPDARTRGRD